MYIVYCFYSVSNILWCETSTFTQMTSNSSLTNNLLINIYTYEPFWIWEALLDYSLWILWICQSTAILSSRTSALVYSIYRNLMRAFISLPKVGMIQLSNFWWHQCFGFLFSNYMNLGIICWLQGFSSEGFPYVYWISIILFLFF